MNYQKIYDDIIKNAILQNRKREDNVIYENHHIIPKCLGGNDKKENLVLLTLREHFICHKLLTRIYPNNPKLKYSFSMMSLVKSKKSAYKVSSRDYKEAKKQAKLYLTSDEVKQKRNDAIFNKYYSPEKIQKYLDSIKHTCYSPDFDRIIHIPFKH